MTVKIELPAEIEEALRERWPDLPRAVLEAVAIEGYRKGALTLGQVAGLLGVESRWDARQFLADRKAGAELTEEDLDKDIQTLEGLAPQPQ